MSEKLNGTQSHRSASTTNLPRLRYRTVLYCGTASCCIGLETIQVRMWPRCDSRPRPCVLGSAVCVPPHGLKSKQVTSEKSSSNTFDVGLRVSTVTVIEVASSLFGGHTRKVMLDPGTRNTMPSSLLNVCTIMHCLLHMRP